MKTRNLVLIFLPILLATAIANLVTPRLYGIASSDFERTKLILNASQSTQSPELLLFGNSILMSGVDAQQLSKGLNVPLAFNFGSNGQALKESMLYYSIVPSSTRRIFQFVRIEDLENELPPITEPIMRNFRMYGYRYDSTKEKILTTADMRYFTQGELRTRFESRVIVPNAINRSARVFLRGDLDLRTAESNLFFPNVYSKRISAETYRNELAKYNPEQPLTEFHLNHETLELLIRANNYFRAKNIEYILVLYPINSDLFNYTPAYKKNALRKLSTTPLKIVDCTNVLGPEEFVDYWHISRHGGKVFTDSLIQKVHAF